ncbi:unnamed protein product, partial [Anisakis simplex]|uniref:Similar to n=1 Tax=Anisakis simplex TaxID=6269 RepID=A0A0M3JPB4_ANISI
MATSMANRLGVVGRGSGSTESARASQQRQQQFPGQLDRIPETADVNVKNRGGEAAGMLGNDTAGHLRKQGGAGDAATTTTTTKGHQQVGRGQEFGQGVAGRASGQGDFGGGVAGRASQPGESDEGVAGRESGQGGQQQQQPHQHSKGHGHHHSRHHAHAH